MSELSFSIELDHLCLPLNILYVTLSICVY